MHLWYNIALKKRGVLGPWTDSLALAHTPFPGGGRSWSRRGGDRRVSQFEDGDPGSDQLESGGGGRSVRTCVGNTSSSGRELGLGKTQNTHHITPSVYLYKKQPPTPVLCTHINSFHSDWLQRRRKLHNHKKQPLLKNSRPRNKRHSRQDKRVESETRKKEGEERGTVLCKDTTDL
jgi:hypothetical protein